MAFVYWIHLPEHADMFTSGYVGVTKQAVNTRFSKHKNDASNGSKLPIHRAIRKYGTAIVLEVLVEADEGYCYEIEGKLRHTPCTGWNIAIGGCVSPMSGRY